MNGLTFTFHASLLDTFPEARAFAQDLLGRGNISPAVTSVYVKLAARLKRQGRLFKPELLVHNTERTAANAYLRWQTESYYARVQPVIRAFKHADVRDGIAWLRVGSVVPPYEGKTIPRITSMPELRLDTETKTVISATPATFGWFPCASWTLHVPRAACPAHKDPCVDCTPIELTSELLEALASAFEAAWGHRNLHLVPSETPLFGEPPRDWKADSAPPPVETGRIVALVPRGALASALSSLRGSVTDDLAAFDARLKEGADVLVIERSVLGSAHFDDIALSVQSVVTELLWAASHLEVTERASTEPTELPAEDAPTEQTVST